MEFFSVCSFECDAPKLFSDSRTRYVYACLCHSACYNPVRADVFLVDAEKIRCCREAASIACDCISFFFEKDGVRAVCMWSRSPAYARAAFVQIAGELIRAIAPGSDLLCEDKTFRREGCEIIPPSPLAFPKLPNSSLKLVFKGGINPRLSAYKDGNKPMIECGENENGQRTIKTAKLTKLRPLDGSKKTLTGFYIPFIAEGFVADTDDVYRAFSIFMPAILPLKTGKCTLPDFCLNVQIAHFMIGRYIFRLTHETIKGLHKDGLSDGAIVQALIDIFPLCDYYNVMIAVPTLLDPCDKELVNLYSLIEKDEFLEFTDYSGQRYIVCSLERP